MNVVCCLRSSLDVQEHSIKGTMVSATQSPSGVSTFEKSFHDYGSNFGLYQLWWFLFSIIGLTLYFFHFLGYVVVSYFSITSLSFPYEFPLLHRTSADALLEVKLRSLLHLCFKSMFMRSFLMCLCVCSWWY